MTRLTIDTETPFFDKVFTPVCRQVKYPKDEVNILVNNVVKSKKRRQLVRERYRFVFDYPNDNDEIVGVEVFYNGEMEPDKTVQKVEKNGKQ